MRTLSEYLEVLVSFLAVSGAPTVVPIFLGLTSTKASDARFRSATLAALTVFLTLGLAIYLGEWIFNFLSISLSSFRVAGGILILLTGLGMIAGTSKPEADAPASQIEGEVGIVPLGIPLLAGPGLISTAIIQSQEVESTADNVIMTALALLTAVYIWAWLAASDRIVRWLGATGLEILTRLSGLILAALAIEFIATGALQLFPGLGR